MRTYKRKSTWLNNTGYTDGSSTSMNNSNTIPSENITMNNTAQPLRAQGLDEFGYPMTEEIIIEPGQNYNFAMTSFVEEKPLFQLGGNVYGPATNFGKNYPNNVNNFSNSLAPNVLEYRSNFDFRNSFANSTPFGPKNNHDYKQSWENNPNKGLSPNYDLVTSTTKNSGNSDWVRKDYETMNGSGYTPTTKSSGNSNWARKDYETMSGSGYVSNTQANVTDTNSTTQTNSLANGTNETQSVVGSTKWMAEQISEMKSDLTNLQYGSPEYENLNRQIQTYENTMNPEGIKNQSAQNSEIDLGDTERFQFFNPYGGMDLGAASYMFGNALESGNTEQSVLSGLKLGTGLARNIFSGIGFANRNKQISNSYNENQRDNLTQVNRPQYMQEGGEVSDPVQEVAQILAEGVSPEEVIGMLIQNGVSEQEAVAIVQKASQMFQFGGLIKSKRVKNYKLNEKTGNYEVEFE